MSKDKTKLIIPLKVPVITLFILIVAVLVVVIILLNQSLLSRPQKMKFAADGGYVYTGTGFIYKNGGTLLYDDMAGEGNYTGSLPHSDMKLSGYGRDTHAVYDESTLCIIGLDNAIVPTGKIESVKCGRGYVACLTQRNGQDCIEVYDMKGELVEEIISGNTIMLYDFTHMENEQIYTVSVDTDSEAYISTISTYDPSIPAMTGIITVQNQLVENVMFTQKSIFVEGTTNMIRYDASDNKESYRLITRGYHAGDSYVRGDKVYCIMHSDTGSKETIRMYITSQSEVPSEKVLPIQLPDGALEVFISGGSVYAITANEIYMYDNSGVMIEKESLEFNITEAHTLGDDRLLMISGNEVYTCTVTGTNSIKRVFSK